MTMKMQDQDCEELWDNYAEDNQSQADADSYYYDESNREDYDVHKSEGLEIKAWPTYGNCTIITDIFHMYWWPGSHKLDIFDLRKPIGNHLHQHVLELSNIDLFFFGEKNGPDQDDKWNIDFYTADQVNRKIERYLNMKVFL